MRFRWYARRMRISRRAQMKMMETFAVMIVFFFLIIIGTNLYSRYQERSFKEEFERSQVLRSIQIAQKALFMPELKCVDEQLLCFDSIKITTFNDLSHSSPSFQIHYRSIFAESNITIRQVYPEVREFTIYTNAPPRAQDRIARSTTSVPITIYDPLTKTSGFGVLNVDVYQNG